MKTLLACSVLIVALFSAASFAKPPSGIAGGHKHGISGDGGGVKGHGNSRGDFVTGGAIPPGLQNKGTPPGLKMLNKTPRGWSKGQKKGWKKRP